MILINDLISQKTFDFKKSTGNLAKPLQTSFCGNSYWHFFIDSPILSLYYSYYVSLFFVEYCYLSEYDSSCARLHNSELKSLLNLKSRNLLDVNYDLPSLSGFRTKRTTYSWDQVSESAQHRSKHMIDGWDNLWTKR